MSTQFKRIESIIKPVLDGTGDKRDMAKPLTNEQLISAWQDLKDFEGAIGGGVIPISWPDFLAAHTGGALTPYRTYAISAPDGFGGATLFVNSIGGGTIDTKAALYDIFGSLFKALQVDLAVVDGTFSSYFYARFYDPLTNTHWYGHPDIHGTDGRNFFDALMAETDVADSTSYANVTVNFNATFEGGFPAICKNFTFGNTVHNFADGTSELTNGSTITNSVGHYFNAGCVVGGGSIGGRGATAIYQGSIDCGGSPSVDLTDKPLCAAYTEISNIDAGGLTQIAITSDVVQAGMAIIIFGNFTVGSGSSGEIINPAAPTVVSAYAMFIVGLDGSKYLAHYL